MKIFSLTRGDVPRAGGRAGGLRLNDCSMKHYIVLNIALFSHAHVTISAEINLTHACSRGEASRSNCHSRLRAFVGMASWNWETVLKVYSLGYANNVILSYYPNT